MQDLTPSYFVCCLEFISNVGIFYLLGEPISLHLLRHGTIRGGQLQLHGSMPRICSNLGS